METYRSLNVPSVDESSKESIMGLNTDIFYVQDQFCQVARCRENDTFCHECIFDRRHSDFFEQWINCEIELKK